MVWRTKRVPPKFLRNDTTTLQTPKGVDAIEWQTMVDNWIAMPSTKKEVRKLQNLLAVKRYQQRKKMQKMRDVDKAGGVGVESQIFTEP